MQLFSVAECLNLILIPSRRRNGKTVDWQEPSRKQRPLFFFENYILDVKGYFFSQKRNSQTVGFIGMIFWLRQTMVLLVRPLRS